MYVRITLCALIMLLLCFNSIGQSMRTGNFTVAVDQPYALYKKVYQQFNYYAPYKCNADIELKCYQYRGKDSVAVYDLLFKDRSIRKGVHDQLFNFEKNDQSTNVDYSFIEVISRFNMLPPGQYVTHLMLRVTDSNIILDKCIYWNIDSAVDVNSGIRAKINSYLSRASGNTSRLSKNIARSDGVTSIELMHDGHPSSALYYKSWFLGFYRLGERKQLLSQINAEESTQHIDPLSSTPSIGTGVSLDAGIRKNNSRLKKDNELTGSIDLSGSFGTGQEPTSQQQNNFGEIRADLHTNVMDIPVMIEGYYTTQDNSRKAKSSFLRVKYDVDKVKGNLNRSVNGYKEKFTAAQSQVTNTQNIYTQLITTLLSESSLIKKQFMQEYGVNITALEHARGDAGKLSDSLTMRQLVNNNMRAQNSDSDLVASKNKLNKDKADIAKKYQRIVELQKRIDKCQALSNQVRDQRYLDSALTYAKVQDLDKDPNVSYKKVAQAAEHILPQGKAASFISGLTKFEVGYLNTYESNYTMSGQTLKGGTIGYDIGFAEAGVSVGKTEYISRDGNLDRYNTYLAKLNFKSFQQQKLGLIYYGYSPTRQILASNNFTKSDVGIPSFIQPVHIVSLTYSGIITKQLFIESEGATSISRSNKVKSVGSDNSSVKTAITYNLPILNADIKGEWEHMGTKFENNSLPYIGAGTERYALATKATIFRSFITTGIQFNYLKQEAFASSGYNTRWGFDVKTNSKRYPNVYVSYKPYSTFRRYDDTLSVPQRPVSGAVTIGRATYQFRRKGITHRFTLLYNQNISNMDTINYSNKTMQLGYYYLDKENTVSVNGGWMKQPVYSSGLSLATWFISPGITRMVSNTVNVNAGIDLAWSASVIQRLGATGGIAYRFQKKPFTVRMQLRYSSINQIDPVFHNNMLAMQLGLNWQLLPAREQEARKSIKR